MSFDRDRAGLTEAQLTIAETIDTIYEAVQGELHDEDPGEIDWDDMLTIVLTSPALAPKIRALITAIGESGGGLGLATLLVGAGAAFMNDNVADWES